MTYLFQGEQARLAVRLGPDHSELKTLQAQIGLMKEKLEEPGNKETEARLLGLGGPYGPHHPTAGLP